MTTATAQSNPITHLSPEEFFNCAMAPKLIDVRTEIEYQHGHAPTAMNLSLHRLLMGQIPFLRNWLLPQWFQELDKSESIAVICLTAHRSPIAANHLAKLGFQQVFNITGGMMAWRKQGLPTCQGKE